MGSFICCPSRSSADYIDIPNDVFSQELNDITRNKFENVVEIRKSSKRYYFEEEYLLISCSEQIQFPDIAKQKMKRIF